MGSLRAINPAPQYLWEKSSPTPAPRHHLTARNRRLRHVGVGGVGAPRAQPAGCLSASLASRRNLIAVVPARRQSHRSLSPQLPGAGAARGEVPGDHCRCSAPSRPHSLWLYPVSPQGGGAEWSWGQGGKGVRCPEHGSPAGSAPSPLTCDLEIDPNRAGLEREALPALGNLGGGRQETARWAS